MIDLHLWKDNEGIAHLTFGQQAAEADGTWHGWEYVGRLPGITLEQTGTAWPGDLQQQDAEQRVKSGVVEHDRPGPGDERKHLEP